MKKQFTLALIFTVSTPAMAGFTNNVPANQGGFNSNQAAKHSNSIGTVAQAKSARDNARFSIVGNITHCYEHDECTFKDSTGTIHLDVEDGAWPGQNINPKNRVRISGKVDRDDGRVTLDVYHIAILK